MAAAEVGVQFDSKRIVELLNSFGCAITPKEINKPTFECVARIYKIFIETCLSVNHVAYEMDPPCTIVYFNEDVIKFQAPTFRFLQFYKLLFYFFDMCGCGPTFYDMFMPNKKMFVKQMSMIINFVRFEVNQLSAFEKIQEENKKYDEAYGLLHIDLSELNRKNHAIKIERSQKESILQEKKNSLAKSKDDIRNYKIELKKLEQAEENKDKEDVTLQAQIDDLKAREAKCANKLRLYEKIIVKSPSRLNKEYEKTDHEITDLGKLVTAKLEENEKIKKNLHEKEKFTDSYNAITEVLTDFYNAQVLKANEKTKEIEKLKKQITNISFELNELKSHKNMSKVQLEKLKTIHGQCEEEFNKENKNLDDHKNSLNLRIKNFMLELSVLEKNKIQLQQHRQLSLDENKQLIEFGTKEFTEAKRLNNNVFEKRDNLLQYYKARRQFNESRHNKATEKITIFYDDLSL